jgi:ribonuclease HII
VGGYERGGRRAERGPRAGVPTLREERRLLRSGHVLVAGMDEVGRGALAGPVTVGVVVVDLAVGTAPAGVRDSKLLVPAAREALVPRLRRWARGWAVGHAEPEEIDAHGIIAALRLAGRRALGQLPALPECVLLDGNHDWLTLRPCAPAPADQDGLFPVEQAGQIAAPLRVPAPHVPLDAEPVVHTMIKADLRCAAVAAASVLAKVERDRIMVERARDFPGYGWEENKGYSAPEHGEALRRLGTCTQHRRSWSLPGRPGDPLLALPADAAELDGAELDGAELDGAELDGAELDGAAMFVLPEPASSVSPPGRPRPAPVPAAP